MENFIFYNPTRILFGKGQENFVGEYAKKYSNRVMLLYGGGSIQKSGLYDRVMASLLENSVSFVELGGIEPNPRLEAVYRGIRLGREEKAGLVLAVGGGSVIDTAKAVAAGMEYDGDVWDFCIRKATPTSAVPIGTVLTIVGAGSEMSNSCVISKPDEHLKRSFDHEVILPRFSILNPELTFTVSSYQTACGSADILSHLMERYFTPVRQADVTDRLLEGLMKTVLHYAPIAMKRPDDYDARAELMWAAALAQNGLIGTGRIGDWGCHAIEHELSGEYDIAHGAGLAMVTSAWMRYVYHRDKERFVQFARRVFDVDFPTYDTDNTIQEGILRLERFFMGLGLLTDTKALTIDSPTLRKISQRAVQHSPTRGRFLPMDANDIYEILLLAVQ